MQNITWHTGSVVIYTKWFEGKRLKLKSTITSCMRKGMVAHGAWYTAVTRFGLQFLSTYFDQKRSLKKMEQGEQRRHGLHSSELWLDQITTDRLLLPSLHTALHCVCLSLSQTSTHFYAYILHTLTFHTQLWRISANVTVLYFTVNNFKFYEFSKSLNSPNCICEKIKGTLAFKNLILGQS